MTSDRARSGAFYADVFCITAATLMLQITQTRILSVVAWYHLAFLAISMGMFGLTAGAIWVWRQGEAVSGPRLFAAMRRHGMMFAASIVACGAVQMSMLLGGGHGPMALMIWLITALCLALPFFFSGVVVSLALTRGPFPVARVYAVDLIGAALGCLAVLLLLDWTSGPAALLWISLLALLGTGLFHLAGGSAADPRGGKRVGLAVGAVLVLIGLDQAMPHGLLRPIYVKGTLEVELRTPALERWNSFSRVRVDAHDGLAPRLWAPSARFDPAAWDIRQFVLEIDGDADTTLYDIGGDIGKARFLRYDVTNLAYHLPGRESAAIIGIGGGRDMLSARVFGVERVTGVEVNPILVDILTRDPRFRDLAGLHAMPGMTLHVDEARSFFARDDAFYDVIQMALIDTWAATGAGAFSLTENGLYTVEGWRVLLRRLTPQGVFTVSRWYNPKAVAEVGRLLSVAMTALFEEGVSNPRAHLFLASAGKVATLVASRDPLSPDMIEHLLTATREHGYAVIASPGNPAASEVLEGILASPDPGALEAFTSGYPFDLTPSRDERPFFFNQMPIASAMSPPAVLAGELAEEGVRHGNLAATRTLVSLIGLSLALSALTILLPAVPALRRGDTRLVAGGTGYFFFLGLASCWSKSASCSA